MLRQIPNSKFYHLINHGPCVFITSGDGKTNNIAPIAWATPVNDQPPMLAIVVSKSHFTAELILTSGEFVVNIPDIKLIPAIKKTGAVSGRKNEKFNKNGLTPIKGIRVKTSHLKESLGFIECKVIDKIYYDGVILFVAKVLYSAVDKKYFNGVWNTKAKTFHHLGGNNFAVTGPRVQ